MMHGQQNIQGYFPPEKDAVQAGRCVRTFQGHLLYPAFLVILLVTGNITVGVGGD
jgi:hypothetical protein